MVNLAAFVGITGAAIGLLLAAFSLGMARSPLWAERRRFALVAASAAGYCLFDVALVLDLPGEVVAASVQVALAFAVAHAVAWIYYLAGADGRSLRPAEKAIVMGGAIVALAGFVPGVLLTRELFIVEVPWLGITYRTPHPTPAGVAAYAYLCASLMVVALGTRRRRDDGRPARWPAIGALTLAVLALNDTLSSAGFITMPLLLDIGSIVIVVVVAVVHERRFAASVHRLERTSSDLQREVSARTKALLDSQAALAASERLAGLGRLTAGVAHEINNPISVVRHSLERIQDQRSSLTPDDLKRHVDNGLAATERVVRIVRRLLDAGRIGNTDAVRAEPFLVAPVMTHAVEMVEPHLAGVAVTVAADPALTALGDPGFVSQVIENLLVNAAHALESRSSDARIAVRAERLDQVVRIVIADNGPGVPEEVRGKLFEPFVTTKVIGRGSGLGLAVSKGLMRSQHGDLVLLSTSEAGTEMALHLPWTPLTPPPAPDPRTSPLAAAAPGELSVLIIDDEPDVREMLEEACGTLFDAKAFGTVAEGLASIAAGRMPDVVLCDLMMPDGGAYEWLTHCRERYPDLAERTIIITGGPATALDEALIASHTGRVLFKPFSMVQLMAVVKRLATGPALTADEPRH